MDNNRISMVSFVWQAAGFAVMLAMPNSVVALHVGSIIVGLSVGNIVSLPPLVIQHEFAPRSIGLLVGLNATVGTLEHGCGIWPVRARLRFERELYRFSLPVHWPATGEFLDHPLRSAGCSCASQCD